MMHIRRICYLFLSFIIMTNIFSFPVSAFGHVDQKAKDMSVRDQIVRYLLSRKLNGSVAIVRDGKTIFNEGVGYANFETNALNQKTTTYPIASITKSIVATCMLQLQEKGMLNIQDPVSKYLPNFPNGNKIKLIHLMNHTSGIPTPRSLSHKRTTLSIIKGIEKRPVKFSAGSQWDYNDENYVILGYILEKVTGISLHHYIEKNIFKKAGMKHSGFITGKDPVPFTSTGYLRNNDQNLAIKTIKNPVLFGYADIFSTAHDICLYDMSLMNGRLVSQESLQEMLTPGSESKYGLGLYNYGYAVHSRGVIGGWESLHVYYKDHTAIAILLNVRDRSIDIHKVSQDLFRILDVKTPNPRFYKVGIDGLYAHGTLVVR